MTLIHGAADTAADELQRLRRCLGDVIALSALPAVWAGSDRERVVGSLADVLLRTLLLDFVYVSVEPAAEEGPLQVTRVAPTDGDGAGPPAIQELLDAWMRLEPAARPRTLAASMGASTIHVIAVALGHAPQVGVLVAGARRPEFPTAEDRALLGVAANQAAVVLQSLAAKQQLLHSEQQLERERWHLREVFTHAPAYIAAVRGPEHVFELANPAYIQLLGNREFLGKPVREVLPGLEGQGFYELLDRVYRTGEPFVGTEMRVPVSRGPQGPVDEFFVNFVYQPLRDAGGTVSGIFVHGVDVTEQVRARQRLHEETRTVQTINQVGRSLAAELDLQKLVQAVTDAGTELTGAAFGAFFYNVGDERGEHYTLYTLSGVPPSAFERFPMPRSTAIFAPMFAGTGVVRLDDVTQDPRYGRNPLCHEMPEGHLSVRSYLAVPVVLRSGEVVGGLFFGHPEPGIFTERAEQLVVGISAQAAVAIDNARLYQQARTELHERERAEALLTVQKGLLEQVARGSTLQEVLVSLARMVEEHADGALCSIMLLDEKGCLQVAAAPSLPPSYSQAVSGIPIGPRAGSCGTAAQRRERVFVGDISTNPLWEDYRELALAHGLHACWSTPVLSSTGAVLGSVAMYCREAREPVEADAELIEVATHLAGIAIERARTEEALARRAAELAARDREKDEFLAMLAHELRNPLAPVLNATQVLQARAGGDPLLQRQSAVIDRQARHMGRLLDDLLDVSRITRGKIELRKQAIDLTAAVEQAVESVRAILEERRHDLHLSLPPEPLHVMADPTRLHQVIGNLLNNAVKYSEPGARITVSLGKEGESAVFSVMDTGMGIAPDLLPRIFDLFTQGDRSLARSESGLGIGLTMVKRLVELHGGTVVASSAGVGQGSEFTVHWPLAHFPASTASRSTAPEIPAVPRRVLIVDDNQDAVETLADLVELWGHEVRTACDGIAALEAVAKESTEIVLLDIGMPGMDGYEVARRLRADPALPPLCLIALTGYGQVQDRQQALDAGFDDHLTKPINPEELRELLR